MAIRDLCQCNIQSGWEMPSEDTGHAIDFGGHDGIPSVGGD